MDYRLAIALIAVVITIAIIWIYARAFPVAGVEALKTELCSRIGRASNPFGSSVFFRRSCSPVW
jgi:hypothetical protein